MHEPPSSDNELVNMPEQRVLEIGAGRDRSVPGAVTVDRVVATGPDVVHDLDVTPWPFRDGEFDFVRCKDVIEHVADVTKTLEEIHRVLAQGGRVEIVTPHYSCANSWTDPTHRHHLGYFSFDYFTGQNQWDFYTGARFTLTERHLRFYGRYKNRHWAWLANRWPHFYEEHLAWIAPAWYIRVVLTVVK